MTVIKHKRDQSFCSLLLKGHQIQALTAASCENKTSYAHSGRQLSTSALPVASVREGVREDKWPMRFSDLATGHMAILLRHYIMQLIAVG